ncbi:MULTISPECIES: hypothetical protein [Rhizobium]|uniref:Uncharacterized protein n=1 Tax=Rhizobium favelukesii TaxID=348824 RepID=W6RD28_9HYPH|nr:MULTISPECIES: hypothetical protein [Rhizobium]MCS0462668.1 hypothetical protein [Rhizobium favelukesii]UFS83617.1 hypothetical protein LPB79_15545 [Rhizobium sp. T136]CDM58774.1 hypothetical protein LPU83_3124 [Rhizobium favelukesii]
MAHKVNAHLDTTEYAAGESCWSIVLAGSETIELVTFWRSSQLDILAKHEISAVAAAMLPEHFTPRGCADGANAAMTEIELGDRTYVVLGEID